MTLLQERNRLINRIQKVLEDANIKLASVIERIDAVTGLTRRSIEVLLGELGWDMSRFPDAAHAASWVGICPGHHETGGKQLSGRIRQGNRWAKAVLVQAAHATSRTQS